MARIANLGNHVDKSRLWRWFKERIPHDKACMAREGTALRRIGLLRSIRLWRIVSDSNQDQSKKVYDDDAE